MQAKLSRKTKERSFARWSDSELRRECEKAERVYRHSVTRLVEADGTVCPERRRLLELREELERRRVT